jgi:hypothetical protein
LNRMLDDLLAAFQHDVPDPLLGLTCDLPFEERRRWPLPVCAAPLDRSRETVSEGTARRGLMHPILLEKKRS